MEGIDYKDLFYNVHVPLVITSDKGIIKLINLQAEEFLGSSHECLVETDFMKLLHESYERSELTFELFHQSLHTQFDYLIKSNNTSGSYTQINYHIHKSGENDFYVFSLQPIKTNDQIGYDLKQRVKAQMSIVNVIDTFFGHPDLDDALTCCLPAICDGCRFPESAVARIQLSDGKSYASERFRQTRWMMSVPIESTIGLVGTLELGYLVEVPLDEGLAFLYEEEKLIKVISRIIGMLVQKWRFVNNLRENEQMIRKITSQVPGNTYMFEIGDNGELNILFINRGTEENNHHFDMEDLDKTAEQVRDFILEADRPSFIEKMIEANQTQKMISFQYRVSVNDNIRWRWLQAVPEKNANGRVISYGATRDITSLVDYIASVEQILFDISHVIRRPISSMLGLTSLLGDNEFNQDEIKDMSNKLHLCAKEMDKFINELNDVYNQKREINSLNIDFSSLIDRRNSLFRGQEFNKG